MKPGDRLWVRENHRFHGRSYEEPEEIEWYRCYSEAGAPDCWDPRFPRGWHPTEHQGQHQMTDSGEHEEGTVPYATKLLPSIHMPRWASRLTLVVTATKIERLQDISGPDSIAEGVECPTCTAMGKSACNRLGCFASQGAFAELWSRLHGRESWDANPEVVAITFAVHRCNIDNLPPQPASSPQAAAPGGDPTLPPGKP